MKKHCFLFPCAFFPMENPLFYIGRYKSETTETNLNANIWEVFANWLNWILDQPPSKAFDEFEWTKRLCEFEWTYVSKDCSNNEIEGVFLMFECWYKEAFILKWIWMGLVLKWTIVLWNWPGTPVCCSLVASYAAKLTSKEMPVLCITLHQWKNYI